MPATLTTTTQITAPVNNIFQQVLLRNAKARAPYFKGSTPAQISFHSGSFTAKWRRFENLTPTVTPLAELTGTLALPTRNAVQPTITDIVATVLKYGDVIILNEEVDLLNFSQQGRKLVEILGIQAGRSLNFLQRNEVEDNSTIIFVAGATSDATTASKITLNSIKLSVNQLQRNSALKFTAMTTGSKNINTTPLRPAFWGLTHVDVEEDIRLLAGFRAVESYAGQTATADGEFGAVGGTRWIASEDASIDVDAGVVTASAPDLRANTTNVDLYSSVVFGMDAVGSLGFGTSHIKETYQAGDDLPAVIAINKSRGSSGVADPLDEISTLAWKSWHVPKILNGTWIRAIRTGASALLA